MADDAVTLGYVHNGKDVAYSWHKSFFDLIGYDMQTGGHVIRGGWAATRFSHNIIDARNSAIKGWLDDPDKAHADWFFWLDTDMGFSPDTLQRLLAVADPKTRPIVGALCFVWAEELDDGLNGYRCEPRTTMFKWVPEKGTVAIADYPVNSVVDVAATGSACILIHRSVFEKMREKHGDTWYDRIPNPYGEGTFSEDISFCLRAAALGFPAFVHTGIRTSHQKTLWVSEADHALFMLAPPATERTAVVVPVLGRPHNAEPFMRSLRASTGLAEVFAVCSQAEDEKAWIEAGDDISVLFTDEVSFACKVNAAANHIRENCPDIAWLFLTGDDVRFHPGWLDKAQHVANIQKVAVVGTNDLGNPRVMAGEHATHMLIRRNYIDEQGASFDGPGIVAHEGYRHWYVDDEIVTAAKLRGEWGMALGSFVEHMHPIWGKGDDDDVYELGQSFAKQDARLWQQRFRQYAKRVPA